jgi:hypothetical protein
VSYVLDDMREILDSLPDPGPPLRLYCGEAILDWFRHQGAPPMDVPGHPDARNLLGIPIVLDPDLGRGQWQLRAGDDVRQEDQIGDGERVWYVPGGGFIISDTDPPAGPLNPPSLNSGV